MLLRVRVIPNSSRCEVVGRIGSTLRVKVQSPAIDGHANEQLVEFLADFFEVRPRMIKIVRGEKGKEKTIELEGRPEEDLEEMLEAIP